VCGQIAMSFLFLLLAIPAVADQVALKNGDRLTGAISKADGKAGDQGYTLDVSRRLGAAFGHIFMANVAWFA
jgi:hypothetical protein